ncbi:hypothetical protein JCM3770_007189 [Rhodotorula araucariae]
MGQGQSQQRTADPPAQIDAAPPASPPRPDEPDSRMCEQQGAHADGQDNQGLAEEADHAKAALPVEAPTPAPLVALDQGDVFKVPGLPAVAPADAVTSPSATLRALPADIEHILSLGANQPDEAERAAAGGHATGQLEQVVRELKENAMRADTDGEVQMPEGEERMRSDELRKVEDEMRLKGVTRGSEARDVAAEEGVLEESVNTSVGLGDDKDVEMDNDDSSESDSDSSSSSDSDDTAAAATARQRNRRGKQRADSDFDDDEDAGVASSKTAPKTEHEVVEPDVAPPPVEKLDEDAQLAKFGKVESVIETVVVVKADTGGDWRVLDEGTVVCWEDRTVIGTIFETFGSVQQPFYSIRFPASSPPDPAVFTPSRAVFYSPNLASFVFTRDLRNLKGSDASNIWDEEVGANEVEFSDDEEEAEYKKRQKADRRARTQSATPGPSTSRASRAPSAMGAAAPPSFPPAHLPARPAVSYADTADDFLVSSVPSASPMNAPAPNRAMMGTAPPPGRVGRRMFERDSGARLEEGEEVEFEFSSGEGSDDDDAASVAGSEGGGAARGTSARGGRGGRGARGGQRGGAPAGGRGRGRGRGAANSPGGRPIAPMPRGRVPSGPGSAGAAGLPSKPAFQADFAMADAAAADGSGRMSAVPASGSAGGSPRLAPTQPAPFAFGAPASGSFAFGGPQGPQSAMRSPPMQHPHAPPPPSGPRASWSGPPASSSSSSGPPPHSAPHAFPSHYSHVPPPPSGPAAYGYRAPPSASYYSAPLPPAGPTSYGFPPSAPGGAGGYSPHAPYAAQPLPLQREGGAGASEGYNPIAVQGGGHLNPRFLAAQQQAQRGAGGQPPQGYYPAPPPPPPQGGQGQGQGQGGYGGRGQGRW